MKYLLLLNKTSVVANRIGQTKGTAEPCNIPRVARQESFGRCTSEGSVIKRHAANKYCFPYFMACYFCSSIYKRLDLVSYDHHFVSKYFKITFTLTLVYTETNRILFFTYPNTGTFKIM